MRPANLPKHRALVIARNLPPLRGGIERLMQHTVAEISRDWNCDVIGPAGCAAHLVAAVSSTVELPAGYFGFLARASAHVAFMPPADYRLCIASNGLMAPLARLAARKNRCHYMVWVHGLDLTYGSPIYRLAFLPAVRAASHVVANSGHTAGLAVAAGVPEERISVIKPGVDIAEPVSESAARRFVERIGLAGHPLLLFVGRLVARKGVPEFVEQGLPRVLEACPDARFLVVGSEPGHAKRNSGPYRDRICAAARRARVESAVVVVGELDDEDLKLAYAASDVLVFPALARPGDVEGFGMVVVEAAAQGTPTVAFSLGGIPDAMSNRNGVLVAPGNFSAMADAIAGILRGTVTAYSEQNCRAHAQTYSWARYGAELRELCRTVAGASA